MSEHTITIKHKCKACKGTGVYVGMGERDGFGVQCHRCMGTGCQTFSMTYEDFEGRIHRDDVRMVLQCNPGICAGGSMDFGGLPYDKWEGGATFRPGSEMRGFTCPAWWYQTADYSLKPGWVECLGSESFCNCKHFPNKVACWERWDREFLESEPMRVNCGPIPKDGA